MTGQKGLLRNRLRDLLRERKLRAVNERWLRVVRDPIKLEIGSGPKRGADGWTTVDIDGADIEHDLRNGFPLSDNSVDAIYSSHLLEHIPYPGLLALLRESHRVLKPEGVFLACVPNARHYIEAYIENKRFLPEDKVFRPGWVETGSAIDELKYFAYMAGEHCYMFDEENLLNTLRAGGFEDVRLRDFDPSLDMAERDHESIYAVAMKSG